MVALADFLPHLLQHFYLQCSQGEIQLPYSLQLWITIDLTKGKQKLGFPATTHRNYYIT